MPKALDFHLTTRNLDLPRTAKIRIQVALSKMNRKQLKETLEYLGDMRYTALNHRDYKMAAYCKSVRIFVEEYYKSIKAQNKM